MNQSRGSERESENRLAHIARAEAAVRNASDCVCDYCGGTITGCGFVDTSHNPFMRHEQCFDELMIDDIHRTSEGHYAYSLAPRDDGEVLAMVRVSNFGRLRSQAAGSPLQDSTATSGED